MSDPVRLPCTLLTTALGACLTSECALLLALWNPDDFLLYWARRIGFLGDIDPNIVAQFSEVVTWFAEYGVGKHRSENPHLGNWGEVL